MYELDEKRLTKEQLDWVNGIDELLQKEGFTKLDIQDFALERYVENRICFHYLIKHPTDKDFHYLNHQTIVFYGGCLKTLDDMEALKKQVSPLGIEWYINDKIKAANALYGIDREDEREIARVAEYFYNKCINAFEKLFAYEKENPYMQVFQKELSREEWIDGLTNALKEDGITVAYKENDLGRFGKLGLVYFYFDVPHGKEKEEIVYSVKTFDNARRFYDFYDKDDEQIAEFIGDYYRAHREKLSDKQIEENLDVIAETEEIIRVEVSHYLQTYPYPLEEEKTKNPTYFKPLEEVLGRER